MSDHAELQQKIAVLQGRIQKHKQPPTPTHRGGHHYAPRPARGNGRWAPYGRGGWHAHQPAHRNRVLVLAGQQNGGPPDNNAPADPTANPPPPTPAKQNFVTAQAAGKNQLMTQDTFLREQKQKQEYLQQAAAAPAPPPNPRPADSTKPPPQRVNELVIDGLRFEVQAAGRKLIRIRDPATADKETPKNAKVADVEFLRTKHGNLTRVTTAKGSERYRGNSGLDLKDLDSHGHRYRRTRVPQCENFTKHGTESSHHIDTGCTRAKTLWSLRRTERTRRPPKFRLTNLLGTCTFGPACRFTHDPAKVAICKDFLRTASCNTGRNCDLSHEPTYQRVPACTHFLRGNCTNNACRYPHVNVSPTASVCRPFATLGFCAKGAECDKRHVFECPDYANHGSCANREKGSCSLPHIDRAGNLRKAAQRQAKPGNEDASDLSSSEEDNDPQDDDSDVEEDMIMKDDSHQLSQQQDFIAFS